MKQYIINDEKKEWSYNYLCNNIVIAQNNVLHSFLNCNEIYTFSNDNCHMFVKWTNANKSDNTIAIGSILMWQIFGSLFKGLNLN